MREKVRKGYEAGDYEGEYRNDREIRDHEKELFRKLFSNLDDNSEILDLGCGTGEPFDSYMVEKGYSVTGIDLVEKHIHAARERVPEAEFIQGDFFDISPENKTFDAVVSFYAVFHLPREKHGKLFKHMNDLLNEDGVLLITLGGEEMDEYKEEDWSGSEMVWSSYSQDKSLELLRNSGFDIMETFEEESEDEHHLWVLAEKN
ncbi:MAG: trans-aconitate 2-methyltransferase [Candidatus Nanosalina sp.]